MALHLLLHFVHPSISPQPVLSLCLLNQIISRFTISFCLVIFFIPSTHIYSQSLVIYQSTCHFSLPFSFELLDHLSKYSPFSLLSHYSQAVIPPLLPLSQICLP